MKCISNDISNEIEIKNSRFITILKRIDSSNIDDILNEIKMLYPKATHYCYGYIYNDTKKSFDDKEPGGTAGMPILNVLEKEKLNNILAVVVRYFGGIKLGAGGLIRAYTKSITEALKKAEYTELIEGIKVEIEFNYNDEKQINYILKKQDIIKKEYDQSIIYTALISKDILDKLSNYNTKIIEYLYIEKKNSL